VSANSEPISLLERELSISLPEQYKSALLAYPFVAGSIGEEMLVADVRWLAESKSSEQPCVPAGERR
jgi:hypothetical protein